MALTANRNLQALIAASPLQRELADFFREELRKEREHYENNPADEFTRGGVIRLRDTLEFIEGSKRK